MKEYFDCLIMTHGTAFGVGAAIFLLTILLVAKRIIGFVLSVILMLIALGASWSINNEAFVRTYLDKWIPSTQNSQAKPAPATQAKANQFKKSQIADAGMNSDQTNDEKTNDLDTGIDQE